MRVRDRGRNGVGTSKTNVVKREGKKRAKSERGREGKRKDEKPAV